MSMSVDQSDTAAPIKACFPFLNRRLPHKCIWSFSDSLVHAVVIYHLMPSPGIHRRLFPSEPLLDVAEELHEALYARE